MPTDKINFFSILIIFIIGFCHTLYSQTDKPLFVNKIAILGGNVELEVKARSLLRLKEQRFLSKMQFDQRLLKLDAISLKTLYVSKGYLSVSVKDSFQISEDRVNIFLIISEGKQYFLKSVDVSGNNLIDDNTIAKTLGLKVNKPYNPVRANTNLPNLESIYHEIGHLFATFSVKDEIKDSVYVNINITEHKSVRINRVLWDGIGNLDSNIVQREMAFIVNEIYKKSKIDLTQQRLLKTGIFSSANFIPLGIAGTDTSINILVELKQFKHREWISEGGYYPIEYYEGAEPVPGAGLNLEWRVRRLWWTSTSFSNKISSHALLVDGSLIPKIRFEMNMSNQWLLSFRIPTQIETFYEYFKDFGINNKPYVSRYGIHLFNIYQIDEKSFIETGLEWEKFIRPSQSTIELTNSKRVNIQKRSMLAHILIDKSDHPLYPRKGNTYSMILNKTGGILGGNRDFFKMDLGLTSYSSMREIVFAGQLKIGKIYGWSSDYRDYQYDLFYLGGSTSLRGWDMLRFNVDENKNPKGNISRIMANAEIRFPLFWVLGGEVFTDGGYLADSFSKFSLSQLEWDAGGGITLITALGPVRLDFAAPVDDFTHFRKWKIQLGVHYLF